MKASLQLTLTLPITIPDEERKLTFFTILCGASKGFMKALKPFEAPQRSVKIKISQFLF